MAGDEMKTQEPDILRMDSETGVTLKAVTDRAKRWMHNQHGRNRLERLIPLEADQICTAAAKWGLVIAIGEHEPE